MNSSRIWLLTLFHIKRISYSFKYKSYFLNRHGRHTLPPYFCHVTLIPTSSAHEVISQRKWPSSCKCKEASYDYIPACWLRVVIISPWKGAWLFISPQAPTSGCLVRLKLALWQRFWRRRFLNLFRFSFSQFHPYLLYWDRIRSFI